MLNSAERQRVLRVIGQCCKFGLLPARVDLSTWKLSPQTSRPQLWKCRLSFLVFVLHAMYKTGSLVTAYFLQETPLHELIIHAMLAIPGIVYAYWYYVLYIQYHDVFGPYVKMTLTGKFGAKDGQAKEAWISRRREYTPQDLLVISLPYMLAGAVGMIFIALMCYPSMKFLLYHALPKEYQTWMTFFVLLLEEARYLIIFCCITVPIWSLQVMSFDLVINQLQLLIDSMQRAARARRLDQVYKSLRRIQMYVGIVNLINCFVIFSWKGINIAMCIGTGYAAIAHFSDYPFFGVMYYICLLDCSFIYLFSYAKAFKIPALGDKVTRKAMMELRYNKSRASKIFKLQIRSIPQMGIKVGEFHMMERESTLIYIHYVLNNIVAMLVANRPV